MYFEKLANAAPLCEATYRVREGELPPIRARITKAGRVLGYVHRMNHNRKWIATTDAQCMDAASGERGTRGEAAAALPIIVKRPATRALRASAQQWTVQVWAWDNVDVDGVHFEVAIPALETQPMPFVDALAKFDRWHERVGKPVAEGGGRTINVGKVTMQPVRD